MSRWGHLDSDNDLPHGFKRIGYDADDKIYTFENTLDGSIWTGSRTDPSECVREPTRKPAEESEPPKPKGPAPKTFEDMGPHISRSNSVKSTSSLRKTIKSVGKLVRRVTKSKLGRAGDSNETLVGGNTMNIQEYDAISIDINDLDDQRSWGIVWLADKSRKADKPVGFGTADDPDELWLNVE